MKRPIINKEEREFMRMFPESLYAASLRLEIAKKKFLRELEKTQLATFIKKLL